MKSVQVRHSLLLLLTALIWGVAFVAQSEGGDAIGPVAFNTLRSWLGSLVLVPVFLCVDCLKPDNRRPRNSAERKKLWKAGIFCGMAMFVASNLQQVGINMGTPAGKAGFLTSCYILIVPILGLLFGKKCGWNIWAGVMITLAGLYLLCVNGSMRIVPSDLMVLVCALMFSIQIMLVDHYAPVVDGVRLSCIQFLVSGCLSAILLFFTELNCSLSGVPGLFRCAFEKEALLPILYAGILSCGVAYTLQIIGQVGLNPTIASLLMSLESVFSVLAGWVILHEYLGNKEILGCVLIFAAVILAQLPVEKRKKNRDNSKKVKNAKMNPEKGRSILKPVLLILIGILLLLGLAILIYCKQYYHVEEEALANLHLEQSFLREEAPRDNVYALVPQEVKAGFIFYPGGKVEYSAYKPFLVKLAENGILCVCVHMPANLAVLDWDAAEGLQGYWPTVKDWYIGGHSLGGAMASYYLGEHLQEFNGLVLMGAYATTDLQKSDLRILSIYGSEDGVMKRDKYEQAKSNYPQDFREVIIPGGNHAGFGAYGAQKGDGEATISQEAQWDETVLLITEWMELEG